MYRKMGRVRTKTKYENKICLRDIFESEKYRDKQVEYEYDFGIGYTMQIECVEHQAVEDPESIVLLGGQGGKCGWWEDCGQPPTRSDAITCDKAKVQEELDGVEIELLEDEE
jgi:hypothetical protein